MTDVFDATTITQDGRDLMYQVVTKITEALNEEFEGVLTLAAASQPLKEMAASAEAFAAAFEAAAKKARLGTSY